MIDDLIPLLQALIRIPSPNPPGDTRAIAAYIAETLAGAGCAVWQGAPEAKPAAVNVVATVGTGSPVIMLHAHTDTVPIAADEARHWRMDPYAAEIRDGRVYGKGSVDDKAPLAAMMLATISAARRAASIKGTLVLVAAAEEEVGGQLGTRWMAEAGHLPASDFIIVGEQTHNRVATAHKGVVRATVRATGRSVHATNPDRGVNAITAMAKAVLALDAYHQRLRERVHPIVGVPTCNVGVIQGGSTANAVPDTCTAYLDRRMIPGEDPAIVQDELRAVIEGLDVGAADVTIGDFLVSNWFSSGVDSTLAQTFLNCASSILNDNAGPIGYLPGSDAKHLTGIARGDMVIFGPGSYEVAHAFDEYVEIDELNDTYRILQRFIDKTLFEENG
jgi:succinyl-diaminopimelate desuccinylase